MKLSARQLAFSALKSVYQKDAFADVAVERVFAASPELDGRDRHLITQLVYGTIRRQRTLDAWIDQLAQKPAAQQPPNLRLILHLGLYQLYYLDQIPPSAAVNTTVDLAKTNGFPGLAGFVNGLLRQALRHLEQHQDLSGSQERVLAARALSSDLKQAVDPVQAIAIQNSYPDWIVQTWVDQFGIAEAEQLCEWFNQPPHIDLRVNRLQTTVETVMEAMAIAGITTQPIPHLPNGLRLPQGIGAIQTLPGFKEGWWSVQDASAQLVGYLLDPQPGEVVIDACAAPGGKTTHLAELMNDQGEIWACDRYPARLKKVQENAARLNLQSIQIQAGDSRTLEQFIGKADRVLVDAPCSGLGTLHRHADARWRQSAEKVGELAQLQGELLRQAATWVKSKGVLVYATCTLHPLENEQVVTSFLQQHPQWQLESVSCMADIQPFVTEAGWLKVLPHRENMDGFFMVRLLRW